MSRGEGRLYDGFLPGRHAIDAVGGGGFRFADMSHRGSLLALPSGLKAWDVAGIADLNPDAFAPLLAERDAFDHLLLGTGPRLEPLPGLLRRALREAGLDHLEPMSTVHAAQTYNILLDEGRRVAAALIALP